MARTSISIALPYSEKRELYDEIYRYLRSMKTEEEVRRVVRDLCAYYSVDIGSFCRDLCMEWSEIVISLPIRSAQSVRIRSIT